MSRRARKGSRKQNLNPVPILIGMVVALVVVAGIIFIPRILSGPGGPEAPMLDYKSYNDGGSSNNSGNVNRVIGVIKERTTTESGITMLHIMPEDGDKDTKLLGLFISKEVRDQYQNINLDITNTYIFTVKTSSKGFLNVQAISSK